MSAAPSPDPGEAAEAREEERFGPLLLHRHVKDDGRTLILYARADEPDSDEV